MTCLVLIDAGVAFKGCEVPLTEAVVHQTVSDLAVQGSWPQSFSTTESSAAQNMQSGFYVLACVV